LDDVDEGGSGDSEYAGGGGMFVRGVFSEKDAGRRDDMRGIGVYVVGKEEELVSVEGSDA
jgi:hypothetical protein